MHLKRLSEKNKISFVAFFNDTWLWNAISAYSATKMKDKTNLNVETNIRVQLSANGADFRRLDKTDHSQI